MRSMWFIAVAAIVLGSACSGVATPQAGAKYPDQGISDTEIKIGGSFSFTGPLASTAPLGQGMAAYFKSVNDQGGVNGRKITFISYDDAYDPAKLAENARKLNEQDKVFAFTGFGGTNIGLRDYTNRAKLPQVFIMAGNTPLGEVDKYPYTRAWWPDISYEGAIDTRYVLDNMPNPKIGTLMLNNDLANSETAGIKATLGDKAGQLVETTFEPSQVDVSRQVLQLREAGVSAVLTQGGNQTINAVKYMNQIGWTPSVFLYGAGSGRKSTLGVIGLDLSKGLYAPLWLKDPDDPQWANDPGVLGYKQTIQKYGEGADPDDIVTANGYAAGEAFVAALKSMKEPTRQALMQAIDATKGLQLDMLYPGVQLNSGPGGRLIFSYQMCQFDGTSWKPIGEALDAVKLGLAK
jgi:branched-chain amino acid transport system substrate-binding protein